MKAWNLFLLLLVAALFIWSMSREGFQDTIAIHGPPYGDEDYPSIVGMMPATLVKALETAKSATKPVKPIQQTGRPAPTASEMATYNADLLKYQGKLVDGTISDVMGDFHTTVYQPATTPLSTANVDTFLTTHANTGFLLANKDDIKTLLVAYFVTQPAGAANADLTAAQIASAGEAAASGYAASLADLGQSAGYSPPGTGGGTGTSPSPTCPTGYTLSTDKKTCNGATASDTKTPTCATGYTYAAGACTLTAAGTTPSPTCPSGYTLSADKKTCTGTTATDTKTPTCVTGYTYAAGACTLTPSSTGGSSTFLTSNSGGNKGNIWGPAFSGLGNNSGPGAISGGPRDYPTLLGPKPKESTMVDGAGIVNPSQHQTLVAGLPSAAGTGSDPNSQFFGSSRVPGDKDLFPNPYVEFTPSTGSSKTEPVPFLSDFSAFFR
jgi:hypothetical protein